MKRFRLLKLFTCLFMLTAVAPVFAAGYTCPTLMKYTSCNDGYYLSNCGSAPFSGGTATGTAGNSCIACPAGYTCTGSNNNCPTPAAVTITYNLNGGSGTAPTAATCNIGDVCSLNTGASASFYRAGYQFVGWSTSSSATTGSTSLTFSVNTTIYAVWTACPAGSFKLATSNANASCTPCGAGSYTFDTGNAACTPCQGGRTTNTTGATSCILCSNNEEWKSGNWNSPEWNAITNTVSDLCVLKTCEIGYYLVSNECVDVGVDYWSPTDDANRYLCPNGLKTGGWGLSAGVEEMCGRKLKTGNGYEFHILGGDLLPGWEDNYQGSRKLILDTNGSLYQTLLIPVDSDISQSLQETEMPVMFLKIDGIDYIYLDAIFYMRLIEELIHGMGGG